MDCTAGRLFFFPTEVSWSTGVCFNPLLRRDRGVCKGEVLRFRVHNADPLGRVITMRPATVSTAVAPRHKDTPLRRHGCAFVLLHTLSVSHSRGLERHSRVPIKPLGVEDSPDSPVHKDARTHSHTNVHKAFETCTCTVSTQTLRVVTEAAHCSLSITVSHLEHELRSDVPFFFTRSLTRWLIIHWVAQLVTKSLTHSCTVYIHELIVVSPKSNRNLSGCCWGIKADTGLQSASRKETMKWEKHTHTHQYWLQTVRFTNKFGLCF